MGRISRGFQSEDGFNKGAWTPLEDKILMDYVKVHGEGKWSNLARKTGLMRCGKSCRLRWMNYLRPDIKRGNISDDEEELIIRLHKLLGNRWSLIAGRLPGRTDNEIKNYWNTTLSKKKHQFSFIQHKPNVSSSNQVETTTQPSDDQKDNGINHTLNMGSSSSQIHVFKEMKIELEIGEIDHLSNSPSSIENVNNGEGFMMDFNVEDICKFLDTDMIDNKEGERDGIFLDKIEDMTSSDKDLLSLASSFLEEPEGWPEDLDLNIKDSDMNISIDGN